MSEFRNNFFQSGGTLPPNFPSYIKREADNKLYDQISRGNFCYILTARQMGKSSLRANVMERLVKEGYACCAFDITQIGVKNINTDSWYFTFLDIINDQLKLDFDIISWWKTEGNITPVYRFFKFLKVVVLEKIKDKKIVFFFDEIDSLLSIDKSQFSTDDFFASIRGVYLERANNAAFNRLCFIVIGVASPNELMNDPARTPFNIGKSIHLENFSLEEASVLKSGLHHLGYDTDKLLREILNWSGGQPVLTQKLCKAIAYEKDTNLEITELVKKHVDSIFLQQSITQSDNTNLLNIQTRIIDNDKYGMQMLNLYQCIYEKGWVKDDTSDVGTIYLKLSGLIKIFNDKIIINNKIYKEKFNALWIEDTRNLIDRPFNAALRDWIDSGKKTEGVIRGDQLDDYNDWCNNRNDLTPQEREFQTFSNNARANEEAVARVRQETKEQIERQEKLVIQEKEKAELEKLKAERQILASEKRKRNIIGSVISIGVISGVLLFVYFNSLQGKIKDAQFAATKVKNLEMTQDSLESDMKSKETRFKMDSAKNIEGFKAELNTLLNEKKRLEKQVTINEQLISEARKLKKQNATYAHVYERLMDSRDSLMAELKTNEVELKKNSDKLQTLNEQYEVLYQNEWLSNYDSEDRSKIVKAYFNTGDTALQENILNDFRELLDYKTMYTADPNYALFSALKTREKYDSVLAEVIDNQVAKIAQDFFFYNAKQDILANRKKDSVLDELYIDSRLSDNLLLAGQFDENYFIIDLTKGERSAPLLENAAAPSICTDTTEKKIYILQSRKAGDNELSIYDYNRGRIAKKITFSLPVSGAIPQIYYKGDDTLAIVDNLNGKVTEVSILTRKVKEISFKAIEKDIQDKLSEKMKGAGSLVIAPEHINYNSRTRQYILVYRLKNEGYVSAYTYKDQKFKEIITSTTLSSYARHSIEITKDKENIIFCPVAESNSSTKSIVLLFDLNGKRTSYRLPATVNYPYYLFNSPDQRYFVFATADDKMLLYDFTNKRSKMYNNVIFEDDFSEIRRGKIYSYAQNKLLVWDFLNTDNSQQHLREKYVLPFKKEFEEKEEHKKKPEAALLD